MEQRYNREYQYYKILGLQKSASFDDIKKAYRLIIRKYHPDTNKDPQALEIAKKINEAYGILSNPDTRSNYDNSEAECPKCWTHEIKKEIEGKTGYSLKWKCRHCGCSFTYVSANKETPNAEAEDKKEEYYVCPRCGKPLVYQELLYRCKNKSCQGIFSGFELKKYYKNSVRTKEKIDDLSPVKKEKTTTNINSESTYNTSTKKAVVSPGERFVLRIICGTSSVIAFVLLCLYLVNHNLLFLGLFIFSLAFSLLSWSLNRYPELISKIKSLLLLK